MRWQICIHFVRDYMKWEWQRERLKQKDRKKNGYFKKTAEVFEVMSLVKMTVSLVLIRNKEQK